jgi:site-specific recombinase XerD
MPRSVERSLPPRTTVGTGSRDTEIEDAAARSAVVWTARVGRGDLARSTASSYLGALERFLRFARASGVAEIADLDRQTCERFVFAGVAGLGDIDARRGRRPAPQTSRIRRIVLRAMWAGAVQAGLTALPDPTLGIGITSSQVRHVTSLTPVEAASLRLRGRCGPEDTLRPVQVMLALGGLSQVEIARLVLADVDPVGGVIDLRFRRAGLRQVHLVVDAVPLLRARLRFLVRRYARSGGLAPSVPLALDYPFEHYRAASLSPMVASSLRQALDAAQITRRGVSPVSIVHYAANAEYAMTGRIEAVADLLGRRSLDSARQLIDPNWQSAWAPHLRAQAERRGKLWHGCN